MEWTVGGCHTKDVPLIRIIAANPSLAPTNYNYFKKRRQGRFLVYAGSYYKKSMEIDESLLDDGDDITICGRDSISSLFIRACGIGPEDVFEDQRCTSAPSSTAYTPFAQSGFPHVYYLARGP